MVLACKGNMDATLPIRCRVIFGNRGFADLLIWKVLEPVRLSRHGFKYRLAYIVDGRRVVCFDYERGKGDHRLLGDKE
jgi:hypothetical protein